MARSFVWKFTPAQKITLGFLSVMLVGGILLSLPLAHNPGHHLSFLDALFTSVSAVCVTGLSVVEIGQTLSGFGQGVLLVLIQIGGLGFMTAASLLFLAIGKRFSLNDRMILKESLNEEKIQGVVRLTRNALIVTAVTEGIGALLLSFRFIPLFGWAKGIYYSVFHSVSAFCNAGFDVFGRGDSLGSFAQDPYVLFIIMALITVGGLGFIVVLDLSKWFRNRCKGKLLLQTKIVLFMSGIFVIGGALLILCVEWNNPETLGQEGWTVGDKIMGGLFQSVTARTAGYASFPQDGLQPVSSFVTIVLMFIGASPGSTGGGIKTTTFAVLLLLLYSIIRGREEVTVFHRRLGRQAVLKAIGIAMLGLLFLLLMTFIISLIEQGQWPAQKVMFETTSAFGTVGLSQSMTGTLQPMSKILLMLCMFAGRVGLMTLIFSLSKQFAKSMSKIRYPEEKIMIG